MKESNYKKLVYNTAIFAIGNFGSKVLTFLIVPLYTYVLTTAEYGVIDLFITSLGMVIPFSTMMVNEALIRYVLVKSLLRKKRQAIVLLYFYLVQRFLFCLHRCTRLLLILMSTFGFL